jgi:hypothetical protein
VAGTSQSRSGTGGNGSPVAPPSTTIAAGDPTDQVSSAPSAADPTGEPEQVTLPFGIPQPPTSGFDRLTTMLLGAAGLLAAAQRLPGRFWPGIGS